MSETTVQIVEESADSYQVIVTNIRYGRELARKTKNRPDIVTLDVPDALLKIRDDDDKFKDGVESFAYNTITRKFGAEVSYCQVWLPMEDSKAMSTTNTHKGCRLA